MNVYQIIQQKKLRGNDFSFFCLRMTCFIEEGRKWFPFIFVITYTEIHFLPSFKLLAKGAQLNHLLHDSFAL